MNSNVLKIFGWLFFVLFATCNAIYAERIYFEDATASSGINYTGESKGSSWGDVNGDGWPDLWVTNRYKKFRLYINNGNGTFSDGSAAIVTSSNAAYGAAWADFDNDGDMDVFNIGPGQLGIGEGKPCVFLVNQGGLLEDRASEYGIEYSAGRGRTPLWFDWNNDGRLDLLLANLAREDGTAPTALFTQVENTFTDTTVESSISSQSSLFAQLSGLVPGSVPYLLLHNQSYPSGIYDYSELPFQDKTESLNFPVSSLVQDVIVADFNGDLLTDFFLARANPSADAAEQVDEHHIFASFAANQDQKAIRFNTAGEVTFSLYGNLLTPDEVFIGAVGSHPTELQFVLSSLDPSASGIYPHEPGVDQGIFIGYQPHTGPGHWELQISAPEKGRPRNFIIESENQISGLETVGFESSDGAKPDQLLLQTADSFVNATAMAGLGDPKPAGVLR